ncbi:GNAT family N-acetyltransferase [uncultured Sphingomonas sp.]|uniref:GNAT family N-acetyltransferase n=1 Tax=uncultured Sphingomonas sp. TaxID=158754 RepID=UPI0035CAD51F
MGGMLARRLRADIGLFAAAVDRSVTAADALAAMLSPGETIGLVELPGWPAPPGLEPSGSARCVQMVAEAEVRAPADLDVVRLTDADAPAMLDLATRTEPGPFRRSTHSFGGFVGVKRDGRLVAMAGTRLALPGHVEVSGVCVDPGHRGRGLARALSAVVARAIQTSGDRPFLHAYAGHRSTIALYESLGFRTRVELDYALFTRG